MSLPVLDPPSAAAVAICHLTRAGAESPVKAVSRRHPRRCGWCDYSVADLARMLAGFDHHGPEANRFRRMPVNAQVRLTTTAQSFEEAVA